MLYLLQDANHMYALVSDSEQANGWYNNISDINTSLRYMYYKFESKTLLDTFAHYQHAVVATFSNISEFHNLHKTHPELLI